MANATLVITVLCVEIGESVLRSDVAVEPGQMYVQIIKSCGFTLDPDTDRLYSRIPGSSYFRRVDPFSMPSESHALIILRPIEEKTVTVLRVPKDGPVPAPVLTKVGGGLELYENVLERAGIEVGEDDVLMLKGPDEGDDFEQIGLTGIPTHGDFLMIMEGEG